MWDSEPDPNLEELLGSVIGQLQDLNSIQDEKIRDEIEYCINIKSLVNDAEFWVKKLKQANDWKRELKLIKADLPMIQNIHSAIIRASRKRDINSQQRVLLSQMALCMELLPATPFDFGFELEIESRSVSFEDSLDCRIANAYYEPDANDAFPVTKTIKFNSTHLLLIMESEFGGWNNSEIFNVTTTNRTEGGFFPQDQGRNITDWTRRLMDQMRQPKTHVTIEGFFTGSIDTIYEEFEPWDYFAEISD